MKVRAVATAAVLMVSVAACGEKGVSASDFVNSVDAVCGTLDADLSDLVAPTAAAEVAGFAGSAAALYRDAIADLNKLSVPGGVAPAVTDAKTFVSNLGQQANQLDDIAATAGVDQATTDAAIAAFETLAATNDDLADGIGAERCVLDPLFADVVAIETTVPVTTVPTTQPAVTTPPVTSPPVTSPVSSAKTIVPLAADLTPNGVFTFVDASQDFTQTYITVLDIATSTASQPGTVTGVEVFDGGALPIARIFVFLPEQTLTGVAVSEIANLVADGGVLTPATFGSLTGQTVTTTSGSVFFVAGNDPTSVGFIMWAVAPSVETLDAAIQGFLAGL